MSKYTLKLRWLLTLLGNGKSIMFVNFDIKIELQFVICTQIQSTNYGKNAFFFL